MKHFILGALYASALWAIYVWQLLSVSSGKDWVLLALGHIALVFVALLVEMSSWTLFR